MRVSRTAQIAAAMMAGVLAVGVISGSSATPSDDHPVSLLSQRSSALLVADSSRGTATIVSLEVPWEPGDTVGATAQSPASQSALEGAPATATEDVASRSVGGGRCGVGDSWTDQVSSMITSLFGVTNIGGYRAGDPGDHGSGLALDVMVADNPALGDSIAQWALENMDSLNVSYVIWQQQINMGGGWSGMEDRGSITENHYDHVHISLNPGWGSCG